MTARRRRGQRGMTIVELLVAMTVMAIVLYGVGAALYNVTGRYQQWADRVNTASIGVPVAAAIQADSRRYVVCETTDHLSHLDLCLPDSSTMVVQYTVSAAAPYSITRRQLTDGTGALIARNMSDTQRPVFWVDCYAAAGAVSGHVHIYGFRTGGGTENFSVYYHAPAQACPPNP